MRRPATTKILERDWLAAAWALATRAPRETMLSVARRAGVSRVTLYRYLDRPEFSELVSEYLEKVITRRRPAVLEALIRAAEDGHPWAQRTFFQLTGDLSLDNEAQEGRIHVVVEPGILRELPDQEQLEAGKERED